MKLAICHPDRPHDARGMCSPCYGRWRRGGLIAPSKVYCVVCVRPFVAEIPTRALYCSETCSKFYRSRRQKISCGRPQDRYFTTWKQAPAEALIRRLRADGLRKVRPRTNRYALRGAPYYSAWRRPTSDGHHLYAVRWWCAEDDEELAA